MQIRIIQGDIFEQDTEMLVNPANDALVLGSWVAGQVRELGWPSVQLACETIRKRLWNCLVGSSVLTDGWRLPCQIVHAVVKPIHGLVTPTAIQNATKSSIELALRSWCKQITYPAMWSWSGKIPLETSAEAMKAWFEEFEKSFGGASDITVLIVLPNEKGLTAFKTAFNPVMPKTEPSC